MLNRKGQNVAEYAILIALVVGAAVAMQTYVKRGLQGRIADAVDYAPGGTPVDSEALDFTTKQYEPYYVDKTADVKKETKATKDVVVRGGITTAAGAFEETIRTGVVEKTTAPTDATSR